MKRRPKMSNGRLSIGDNVMISLPHHEKSLGASPLLHFEGVETVIRRVRVVSNGTYYECSGVKSKYGVHYGLLSDWLIKMR
jgi:hypothetical protein